MRRNRAAFTLIELLVVVAIIGLLVAILVPALSAARQQAVTVRCQANLRTLAQGLVLYSNEYRDALVPGRLPQLDDCNAYATLLGARKYRPTFLAMLSLAVNVPPFDDPQACRTTYDRHGERGDRQNYSYGAYVCPAAADWTDERNGSYGYNYQFLGNSRLLESTDLTSYKNWPVLLSRVAVPARTVAIADSLGTAAHFAAGERLPYDNNGRGDRVMGNEGFNLDPPRVDPVLGEMADLDGNPPSRSGVHARHRGRAGVAWLDGHVTADTPAELGYRVLDGGQMAFDGDNTRWSGNGRDRAWQVP
jgi:prepilin-type N-terminal cleavage/methylation domain-containing protein/prepilin-type processing-associated H-X9-DG protein